MKGKTLSLLKNLFLIMAGNTTYALGIVIFLLPNGMITGGTTGLGLAMEHYFGVQLSLFVLLFNTLMFVLGAVILGKKFALTTLVSSFYYPVILNILERFPSLQEITRDRMLSVVCGGIMIGVGIGVVIRAGASTGGMDIPPLILNKKFGLPVSVMLYVFDVMILGAQMLFSDKEQIVYGILLVLIYTVILDRMLLMGSAKTQVKIISKEYEELNRLILERMDRGSTLVQTETGYLRQDQPMILTVISSRELPLLNRLVQETDPEAFMIIGHVNEVKGRGFSLQKTYEE